MSVADRVAGGRAARKAVPRQAHAGFEPAPDRPDPLALLESQAGGRVPELLPIRYGRMLASPLAFYRGAALIMAADLASTPASGLRAQLCGDAHLSNFGVFASPERRWLFDLNDFDETLPGPWEWDVKRLVASIAVAGRGNEYSGKQRAAIITCAAAGYRDAMAGFARMRNLDVWYARLDADALPAGLLRSMRAHAGLPLAAAGIHHRLAAASRLTHVVGGEPRFVSHPPLLEPVCELVPGVQGDQLREGLNELVKSYRGSLQTDRRVLLERYRIADVARKVVGVGSVGMRDWVVLLLGRDADDALLLQFKETHASVLERSAGRAAAASNSRRVVAGQHLMQAASDIFLGWPRRKPEAGELSGDYYGRQLRDPKGSADIERMKPKGMAAYARACAWTLARAHARSGDAVAIAAYLGSGDVFDRAMVEFAEAYADQNQRDHERLVQAVQAGQIEAAPVAG
jgi:hypothetical protein